MKQHGFLSEIRSRRQWKRLGQQVHKYKNLLNREFHTERPNSKLVTDISYIHTGQGVLYLSMIRDLYDNSIVACKTVSSQTVSLVLDTIRLAVKKEKVAGELHLHSDQGFQYTSQAYFNLTKEYGITPSMSRRGNCYDNAMAENFFGILKTECICRQKLKTFQQANDLIDEYIHFYNSERIQTKTGLAPLSLRQASLCFFSSTPCRSLFILSAQPEAVHKEGEKIPSFVPSLCSLRLQETRPAAGRNVAGAEKRVHFQQKGIRKMGGMEK